MLIPVYFKNAFVRFVTHRQSSNEVACKILKPRKDFNRVGVKKAFRGEDRWIVFYQEVAQP
jgi:hypothetical protein